MSTSDANERPSMELDLPRRPDVILPQISISSCPVCRVRIPTWPLDVHDLVRGARMVASGGRRCGVGDSGVSDG